MIRVFCIAAALLALCGPAAADLDLAEDMTCDQAIAYYQKNHLIYVLVDGKFVTALKAGTPINDPPSPECHTRGFWSGGTTIRTRDHWRCTIARSC